MAKPKAYTNTVYGLMVADGHIEVQPFNKKSIELTIWGDDGQGTIVLYLTPDEARILIINIENGLVEAS